MPNVGGMLSFLQTPPEEYVKRLVEQVKETPEATLSNHSNPLIDQLNRIEDLIASCCQ